MGSGLPESCSACSLVLGMAGWSPEARSISISTSWRTGRRREKTKDGRGSVIDCHNAKALSLSPRRDAHHDEMGKLKILTVI